MLDKFFLFLFLDLSIDSSPYQGSCPCPIQTFPKNVHIGPLIGSSQTDKGPCQKNSTHLHDTTAAALNQIQVKTENPSKGGKLDVMVKPEIVDSHTQYDTIDGGGGGVGVLNHKNIDTINRSYEKIALVPQHHPNYTLNPKLLEQPEMSISPARGSIGPGIPKVQAGATQPIDILIENEKPMVNTMLTQNQTPVTSNRRARVGKNMAREMMLQSRSHITDAAHDAELNMQGNETANQMKRNMSTSTPIKEQLRHDEYETNELSTFPHFLSASNPINGKLIKQEDVKKECDDDILMISDKSETETISSDTDKSQNGMQIIDLSCENGARHHHMDDDDDDDESHLGQSRKRRYDGGSSPSEIIDVDEDVTVTAVKRRKIMEFHKNPSKKSPPNSYKSLIKPSETKSYLCRAENVSPKDKDQPTSQCNDEVSFVAPNGMHEPHDLHAGNARDMDVTMSESNPIECNEIIGKSLDTISLTPSIADEFPQELSAEEENFMSHLDSHCEGISKGYCSDNELLSRKKERLKTKLQKCEGRSRSESKKSDKVTQAAKLAAVTAKTNKATKSRKTSRDRSTSSSKSKERSEKPASKKPKLSENGTVNNTTTVITPKKKTDGKSKNEKSKTSKAKKSCDNKSKKATPPADGRPNENDCNSETNTEADDELLDNESHHNNNNNNNCILFDKNNKMSLDSLVAPSHNRMTATSTAKKSKSRGSKFSNKKRHRQRSSKHIEEVFIPRQSLAAPRWSNGWNWQGEPFQGKVFLNVSD